MHNAAEQFAGFLFLADQGNHIFRCQWLEIEPIRCVVIRADGLRVAIDHDGLKPGFLQRVSRMDAAIIEFNALADTVRPAAQDDDFLPSGGPAFANGRAETTFIGGIHIGRFGCEFGGAGINALIDRRDTKLAAKCRHFRFAATNNVSQALIGKTHGLDAAQCRGVLRQAIAADARFLAHQLFNFAQEPRVEFAGFVDGFHTHARAHGLRCHQNAVRCWCGQRSVESLRAAIARRRHFIQARKSNFQPAQALLHGFRKGTANGHGLTNRFHGGGERGRRAGEFFKGEARDFHHYIINGGLKARGGYLGDVIGQFIKRIANGKLRRDLRDGKARGLGGERGRPRHARVHFNNHHAPIGRVDAELHIGTAGIHADFTQTRDGSIAHALIFLIGQRQRRGDGDGITRMHAHRIQVFDGTDDDAIIRAVADHFHFKLFPAQHAFFHQHFTGHGSGQTCRDDLFEFFPIIGNAAAGAAKREGWPNNAGQAHDFQRIPGFRHGMRDFAFRAFNADFGHCIAEFLPVFGFINHFRLRTDQFAAVFFQNARFREFERGIERRLSAHGGQQSIGAFLGDDFLNDLNRDRFDIGGIRQPRIGHDRGRVGIDQNDAIALSAERLAGLRARIVKFAGLADDDRPGADDHDGFDVGALRHGSVLSGYRQRGEKNGVHARLSVASLSASNAKAPPKIQRCAAIQVGFSLRKRETPAAP